MSATTDSRLAEQLEKKYVLLSDGGMVGAYPTMEEAKDAMWQRSYDLDPSEFFRITHQGDQVWPEEKRRVSLTYYMD